jgi:hypothetical protein
VVHDEAERLNSDIQNLLDATRITRDQVKPRMEWIEPQDIVNSALERRRRRLAGHSIAVAMDSNVPLIYVDPVLVEQAFVQIVDNAAKYSPAGSSISSLPDAMGRCGFRGSRQRRGPDPGRAFACRRTLFPGIASFVDCVRFRSRALDRQGIRGRQRRPDPGDQPGCRLRYDRIDPISSWYRRAERGNSR